MSFDLTIAIGPTTSSVTKEEAEAGLRQHQGLPKNASVALDEVGGRWVAAVGVPKEDTTKVAAPPAFLEGGGDEAPSEEAPAPESEGPPSDESESEDKPKPEGDGEDKGKDKGDGEGKKPSVEQSVQALTDLVTQIATALGIAPAPDANPVPGLDGGPPTSPDGLPPAPAGPPHGADGLGPDGKSHTVHERALKPGESQPGTTPVGAPAFASLREDHPWKKVAGELATFTVEDAVGDTPTNEVYSELSELATEAGYNVRQFRVNEVDGQRVAKALISSY